MKNYVIRSLSFYTKDKEIELITSNPEVIPLLILKRVYNIFKSKSCTKTRLSKVWGKVLEEIGNAEISELIPFR